MGHHEWHTKGRDARRDYGSENNAAIAERAEWLLNDAERTKTKCEIELNKFYVVYYEPDMFASDDIRKAFTSSIMNLPNNSSELLIFLGSEGFKAFLATIPNEVASSILQWIDMYKKALTAYEEVVLLC